MSLLQRVLEKFPSGKIRSLVADREFVGTEWFAFLMDNSIPFVIRVKGSYKVAELGTTTSTSIFQLLKGYDKRKKVCNIQVKMWGLSLYLSFRKGKKGSKEPMILVSNQAFHDPLAIYKSRWHTETLFGCLKTRGFRMEDTHVTDPDKIEKILFVLTIAFYWAYRTGDLQARKSPIPLKTHRRKAKSIFRLGLDIARRVLMRIGNKIEEIERALISLINLNRKGYES